MLFDMFKERVGIEPSETYSNSVKQERPELTYYPYITEEFSQKFPEMNASADLVTTALSDVIGRSKDSGFDAAMLHGIGAWIRALRGLPPSEAGLAGMSILRWDGLFSGSSPGKAYAGLHCCSAGSASALSLCAPG